MPLPLILSITALAVVDSLNPTLFMAQFYLFTTPQPVARTVGYIAGILAANIAGGLLLLAGLRVFLVDLLAAVDPSALAWIQLIAGVGFVGFGLWYKADAGAEFETKKPRSLRPIHTFLLGMVVMANELTTALPYFVAIERIGVADLAAPGRLLAILLYNLIFAVPLVVFLWLFVRYGSRFEGQIAAINRWLQTWLPRLFKYGSLLFGAVLIINALRIWLSP